MDLDRRTRTTSSLMTLRTALEKAAEARDAQASPGLATLETEIAKGLEALDSGGGGNRTRVRGRTGQNVYKRSPRFSFDRRPEADALPTV